MLGQQNTKVKYDNKHVIKKWRLPSRTVPITMLPFLLFGSQIVTKLSHGGKERSFFFVVFFSSFEHPNAEG